MVFRLCVQHCVCGANHYIACKRRYEPAGLAETFMEYGFIHDVIQSASIFGLNICNLNCLQLGWNCYRITNRNRSRVCNHVLLACQRGKFLRKHDGMVCGGPFWNHKFRPNSHCACQQHITDCHVFLGFRSRKRIVFSAGINRFDVRFWNCVQSE